MHKINEGFEGELDCEGLKKGYDFSEEELQVNQEKKHAANDKFLTSYSHCLESKFFNIFGLPKVLNQSVWQSP